MDALSTNKSQQKLAARAQATKALKNPTINFKATPRDLPTKQNSQHKNFKEIAKTERSNAVYPNRKQPTRKSPRVAAFKRKPALGRKAVS